MSLIHFGMLAKLACAAFQRRALFVTVFRLRQYRTCPNGFSVSKKCFKVFPIHHYFSFPFPILVIFNILYHPLHNSQLLFYLSPLCFVFGLKKPPFFVETSFDSEAGIPRARAQYPLANQHQGLLRGALPGAPKCFLA